MLNFPSFFNAQVGGYEIEQSLRFNSADSAYLSRNQISGSPTSSTTWTWAVWCKRAALGNYGRLMGADPWAGKSGSDIGWGPDDKVTSYEEPDYIYTNGVQRDTGAWMHFVFTYNGTNSKIYINGAEASTTQSGNLTGTSALNYGNSAFQTLGASYNNGGVIRHWDGYMAEAHFIDGTALTPSSFGEPDDNGVWRPIKYTGSYGSNGWYLKFDPSATNGIGHDHSGNGNNFSPTNFDTTNSTASTYDVMSDTPTTNWCTWNPLSNNGVTISNGNLDTSGGASGNCKGTLGMTSGKWYWEFSNMVTGTGTPFVMGLAHVDGYTPNGHDNWRRAVYFYTDGSGNSDVRRFENGSNASSVTVPSSIRQFYASDVLQIAFDADTGKVWTGKNNSWLDSSGGFTGNPSTGANPTHTFPDTTIPMTPLRDHAGVAISATANFGQRAFAYTPPTGFKPLNTANLPAPTVKDGSQYFDTKLYTANNQTAQTITGLGFSPDLLWFKPRSRTEHHYLYDQVRGAGNRVSSSQQIAEITGDNSLTAFTSDGFSLGADGAGIVNYGTDSMVAWAWDANGAGSSNTDGSITSTVSANPSAGFSIVTWNGSAANGTVGHGLGVAPSLIIFKRRNATTSWPVYHSAISPSNVLYLNELSSQASSGNSFGSTPTAPTSTVFSVGDKGDTNYGTMIAYCFAEVEGYSKVGMYRGNSSNDGTFVYTGFTPSFILVKGNLGQDWFISDAKRDPYNVGTKWLRPNLSNVEIDDPSTGGSSFDILSNGFKWRTNTFGVNRDYDYYYIAFASSPFGGSGVSPATAR